MKKTLVAFVLCLAFAAGMAALATPAPAQTAAKPAGKTPAPAPAQAQPRLTSDLLSGLAFRNIGPAIMSGRISDIAIHPLKRATWYVAVGSGGVWKTENAGTTWTPVFDAQPSYSIGCLTLDLSNPEIVWVGTGENVSGRHVGYGDGVYKSLNGGKTWTNTGLAGSEHIARILVDPRDSNVVYVAAEGPLWSAGGERGLYKTTDGGRTWTAVLAISKDTGVASAELDPSDPDTVYAAAYQRRRSVAAFMGGGPEGGIHKSEDGGKTWRKLAVGLPKGDVGKIGLAVSPLDPRVVYATVEAGPEERGFYRSTDRGESWEKRSDYISGGTGPHYYQEIFADPTVFDRVYQMDPGLRATDDGGKTWRRVEENAKHGDNHAMAFVKGDADYILNGSDGGVYETRDGGRTWRFFDNLPVTQIYKMALDNALPFYNVHGGTQDNGSQLGPSRTPNAHGISNADWTITYGADGYATAIDPTDPNTIYLEWQMGNLLRYDKRSHETVYISPRAEPGDPPLRFNWDAPVLISPHAHTRLYYAGQFVWRSEDRGNSWTRISPDLTRGIFRLEQKIMGRQWSVDALWDHGAMSQFGTVTCLSESRLAEGLIYAGTDDGLIQVTEDGGKSWRKVDKMAGVPDYFFVNDIRASKHDRNTVYAAVDSHKTGDYRPFLMMSADRGRTWTNIGAGLPARTLVWAVDQDHIKKELLFAGTEFGIYATVDGGKSWLKLAGGVPTISFRDIEVQEREGDLVGASFGRSFFVLDDYAPLREMTEEALAREAALFPARKALRYIPLRPIDSDGKGCLGDGYYTAPNPPFGAVFTYHLRDGVKGAAEVRREEEAKLVKDGKPVPFPGWDRLRAEENEEKPAVVLTIADETGQVVRRLTVPAGKGLHRVAWNLRYATAEPTQLETSRREIWQRETLGPMVVPGKFTATLQKKVDGALTTLAGPVPFVVESLEYASLPEKDKAGLLAFQKKAGELQRAMMGAGAAAQDALGNLRYIRKALLDAPKADPKLAEAARAIEKRIQGQLAVLYGDPTRGMRSEPAEPSILERVQAQLDATGPITETAKRGYDIAAEAFGALLEDMRQTIDVDLKKLQTALEAAGAPWTPGRGVPIWKK
ncbi:MAG: glycosyl hydrolase [Candidatus Aminicenantes bacterium]|nr:glycosyl hydrolase [Candidatus Aminicenantes bacterium]